MHAKQLCVLSPTLVAQLTVFAANSQKNPENPNSYMMQVVVLYLISVSTGYGTEPWLFALHEPLDQHSCLFLRY